MLRLPGKFFIDKDLPLDPKIYVEKFREHMRRVHSSSSAHHDKRKTFAHKTLYTCTHVFVRVDAVKNHYNTLRNDGSYKIVKRLSDRDFALLIKGKKVVVNVERLKPVFVEATEGQFSSDAITNSAIFPTSHTKSTTTNRESEFIPSCDDCFRKSHANFEYGDQRRLERRLYRLHFNI